ncbi:MAG: hypothetical protein JST26_19470 [Bacteroidetes bacterium]|nr:hypothetical protein [Bacteroidota bacterium]
MKIEINDHRKIFAIQEEFKSMFPNLELLFYVKPSNADSGHPHKLIKASSKTLAECRSIHNIGIVTIMPNMTIREMKQNFSDVYGLMVEVLHRGMNNLNPADQNKMTLQEWNLR